MNETVAEDDPATQNETVEEPEARNYTIAIDQNRTISAVRVLQLEDEPGLKHLEVRYLNDTDQTEEDECCWQEFDILPGQYIIGMRVGTDMRRTKVTRLDLLLAGEAITDTEEN